MESLGMLLWTFFLNAPKIPADLIIRRVESLQQAPAVQHKLTPWLKAEA
jgi:hypothetical protein